MIRAYSWLLASILILALIPLASAHGATLLYTNDIQGELEPCGCRENPYGGLVRMAGLISTIQDPSRLYLDAGNLLFSTEVIPDPLVAQSELQADSLLGALKELGLDATVPGPKDFALGIAKYRELLKKHGVPALAANLRLRKGGKHPFEAFHKFDRTDGKKRLRVTVIGLTGPSPHWPSEIEIQDPIATAKALVKRLRDESDVLIALTHQGLDRDAELAAQVPGIQLIVGGGTESFLQEPKTVQRKDGRTVIFQSSFRNQYVGVQQLAAPTVDGHRLVALDGTYENPKPESSLQKNVRERVARFKAAVAELNTRQSESAKATLRREGMAAHGTLQTFPRCAECHWTQFDFWRKTPHAAALSSLRQAGQLRNKECLSCHTAGMGSPAGWSEISELGSLRAQGQDPHASFEPEELEEFLKAAHGAASLDSKVRLTRKAGTLPLRDAVGRLDRVFATVQCETCHGSSADHPISGEISKLVARESCLECHTAERAPKWYKAGKEPDWDLIDKKKLAIACPAGD